MGESHAQGCTHRLADWVHSTDTVQYGFQRLLQAEKRTAMAVHPCAILAGRLDDLAQLLPVLQPVISDPDDSADPGLSRPYPWLAGWLRPLRWGWGRAG